MRSPPTPRFGRSLAALRSTDRGCPSIPGPITVIAPPLRGDGWLATNGCCSAESIHRAVRIPVGGTRIGKQETFAIDWARLREGQPFAGDGTRPEDWYGFGAEVLAVADGTVVSVTEGYPEEVPLQPVTHVTRPEDYGGNAISLESPPVSTLTTLIWSQAASR